MIALDLRGAAALAAVVIEWLALGWASGVSWPGHGGAAWGPRWALRLMAGAFLVGFAMLVEAALGLSFASIPATLGVALAGALLFRRAWPATTAAASEPSGPSAAARIGWVLLGLVLAAATLRAALVPEAGWDAYSHWGLKAKAYVLAGTIVDAQTAHEYYPPLVPLLEAWLYLHRGGPSIDQAKLLWSALGGAFALALAYHAQLVVGRRWVAPFLALGALLGSTQLLESFWTGQADLALTAYLTLTALALWEWQRACSAGERRGWLMLAGLWAAGASLAKYEGFYRLAVLAAALLVDAWLRRGRPLRVLLAGGAPLLAAAAALAPWLLFRAQHGIQVSSEHLGSLRIEALGGVLVALAASFGGVRTGGGWLVVALGFAAIGRGLLHPPWRFLALVVAAELGATLLAFLLTGSSPALQVLTSATRLAMQIHPLALLLVGFGLERALAPARVPEPGVV